jgi:hypothetical protein
MADDRIVLVCLQCVCEFTQDHAAELHEQRTGHHVVDADDE